MTPSNKVIAVFGCKNTTKFMIDFLCQNHKLDVLVTISLEMAEKNIVADYCDLKDYAESLGITVYTVDKYTLKSETDTVNIKNFKIDIAFVIGWQRLLTPEVLDNLAIGAFGMHGSSMNLPLGRGRSPMNWSLIEGRSVFYTNLFKYDSGVDSGDVVDTFKFGINNKDTAETMHYKNMLAMRYLIQKNIANLLSGNFRLTKQPDNEPTYYPKRTPQDNIIDWNDDVYRIERFIRAVTRPFGGAFTFNGDHEVRMFNAQIFDLGDFGYENEPIGSVVEVLSENKILVKAYGGLLLVNEFGTDARIMKGSIFHNNGKTIKSFPTNRYGFYDLPEETVVLNNAVAL